MENYEEFVCEGTNQVRHLKIDELSLPQERDPAFVSQLLAQIQGLQNQVDSLSDARGMRFWIAAYYTEHYGVLQETFLKAYLLVMRDICGSGWRMAKVQTTT